MKSLPEATGTRARLLADIGGTNARFAWQARPGCALESRTTLSCAAYPDIASAVRAYLHSTARHVPPACAFAIANPVDGDVVAMTNHHWHFSIAALRAELGSQRLLVINDFTALALALPQLAPAQLRQVGAGRQAPGAPLGLVGAGTGLGVSGLLPDGSGGWLPLQGEGGHATMAAATVREWAILEHTRKRYGHASAERVASGPGLADIHRSLLEIDGLPAAAPAPLNAAEIVDAALVRGEPACIEALNCFCAFLGTAAGNLALTLGARGGIYIGGGIVPRLGTFFDRSPFRERFEAKGRFRHYLAAIPTFVIQAEESPALLGAACALDSNFPFPGRTDSPGDSSIQRMRSANTS